MTVTAENPLISNWRLRQDETAGEHEWVGAANVQLTQEQVEQAERRKGIVRVPEAVITVLEAYCGRCRLGFDKRNEPCVVDERLRGGPIGTRKRRPREDEDGEANGT